MAIETKRGCGYRKVGGLYLVGLGDPVICDRLPYPLEICPCCGSGIKPTRGFTWIKAMAFFGPLDPNPNCICTKACPICWPAQNDLEEKYGLIWVGEKFYPTPKDFVREAEQLGISRRIAQIPRGLKLGETWILFAHRKAMVRAKQGPESLIQDIPGIFYAFRPQRIEKIITESQATEKTLKDLEKRSITPVIVPDNDPDHNPAQS